MLIRFHASAFLIITLSLGTLPGQSSNTTLVGRWDAGICYAVDVEGNYAYFGIGSYLEVADISDPANSLELGKVVLASAILGIAVSGSYAYVAGDDHGLRIIDLSAPSSPQEVGSLDTGGDARGVSASGSYAYVAEGADGLRIIDVSSPASPQEVGFLIPVLWLEALQSAAGTHMWPILTMDYTSFRTTSFYHRNMKIPHCQNR